MRKLFLAGNWKMHKNYKEATSFFDELNEFSWNDNIKVGLFVPGLYAQNLAKHSLKNKIAVGVQNGHFEDKGAYTGEWSMEMIKDINIDWVLIGHSERRQYFNETNHTVNLKIKKALDKKVNVIFCCGETLEERNQDRAKNVLEDQIKQGLKDISEEEIKNITIAYEPVWAIGTGVNATKEEAEDMCKYIRGLVEELYNKSVAETILIQYGGSVKPENIISLMEMPNIDGALIGGASLKIDSFKELLSLGGSLYEK